MDVYTQEDIPQGSTEWMSFREGKFTGTKLDKLFKKNVGKLKIEQPFNINKPNIGFYELLAERIAVGTGEDGYSSNCDRGHRLESEAIDLAEEKLSLKFERGGVWQSKELPDSIASPDGYTKDLTTAIEAKCLASARHIKAIIEDEPPQEYWGEYINYFLINPKLQRLYIVLYDDRFLNPKNHLKLFCLERFEVEDEIKKYEALRNAAELMLEELVKRIG